MKKKGQKKTSMHTISTWLKNLQISKIGAFLSKMCGVSLFLISNTNQTRLKSFLTQRPYNISSSFSKNMEVIFGGSGKLQSCCRYSI